MTSYRTIGLLFTRGISLQTWKESGLLDREKLIYEKLLETKHIPVVYWFSYGVRDLEISKTLKQKGVLDKRIEVVQMPKVFSKIWKGDLLYSFLLPFIHYRYIKNIDIVKSNQMDGAWTGLIIKLVLGRPFYFRTGYTLSKFEVQGTFKWSVVRMLERFCYKFSSCSAVSSIGDQTYILDNYFPKVEPYLLRNFIDCEKFYDFSKNRMNKFVFIGRLERQKNLFNLIKTFESLDAILHIYGDGSLKRELLSLKPDNVFIFDKVANEKVPQILNEYKYYILPSHYEGMPKSLLEALSCGNICIGTPVDGIKELIIDEETGFLAAGTDSEDLKSVIKRASIGSRHEDIKKNAIRMIKENFSLDSIARRESEIYDSIEGH